MGIWYNCTKLFINPAGDAMQEKGDLSGSTDEQRHIEIEATRAGEELAESYAGYLEMVEGRVVGRQERDDMVQSHVEHAVSPLSK